MDYVKIAERAKNLFFNDADISQNHKDIMEKFLKQYDVSPARVGIFMRSIRTFLKYCDDVTVDMHDSTKMNEISSKIKGLNYSDSFYQTIFSCARRLCIWLNDGDKPKGLKDISITRKKYERKLKASDMIGWADIEKVIANTNSVQVQAILAVLLDSGCRPSEFVNLKYKDVEYSKPTYILDVDGKTGQRMVPLVPSCPYLETWLNAHPTKKPNDPLWVLENPSQSRRGGERPSNRVKSYTYESIQKMIRKIFKEVGINKPVDFYNFRHSAAVMMALENVDSVIRANKMGHSVEVHARTYGRFDKAKELRMYQASYGIVSDDDDNKPKHCTICSAINKHDSEYCYKCHNPMSMAISLRDKENKEKEQSKLMDRLAKLESALIIDKTKSKKLYE